MEIERLALNALGSLTPLLALTAFMVPLLSKLAKNNRVVPFIAALTGSSYAAFASSVVLYYVLTSKKPLVYMYGGWPPHFGIVYEVDSFNAVIGALTAWVMIPIVLYSHWYSRHLDDTSWYYTLLIGLEVGILGCLYTGDAFKLFVMIEV
ncbi:MAG: cation:proton antiporter, partial [Desulfurococcaceae archaeon]